MPVLMREDENAAISLGTYLPTKYITPPQTPDCNTPLSPRIIYNCQSSPEKYIAPKESAESTVVTVINAFMFILFMINATINCAAV